MAVTDCTCFPPGSCAKCRKANAAIKRAHTRERGDAGSPTAQWFMEKGFWLGNTVKTPDGYGIVEREAHRSGTRVVVSVRLEDTHELIDYTKDDIKK